MGPRAAEVAGCFVVTRRSDAAGHAPPLRLLLFTPALELVACEEANDLLGRKDPPGGYFRFLSQALSKAKS